MTLATGTRVGPYEVQSVLRELTERGISFEELTYEGMLGGAAILVDVLTDNRNRTSGEIRKIFERSGGKMGSGNSAAYLFDRKGHFTVDAAATDEDTLMGIVLDGGAEDMKRVGNSFDIVCDPTAFNAVQEVLKKNNITPAVAELAPIPKVPVDVDAETGKKLVKLMENLDDHDDTQNVYSNANITEEMLTEVE